MRGALGRFCMLLVAVVLAEWVGVVFYLAGYRWGILLTVGFAALLQGLVLLISYYSFKLVFAVKQELEAMRQAHGGRAHERKKRR